MTPHLTDMQVDLYLDDALAPEERWATRAHLVDCALCRGRLEALQPFFEGLAWLAVDVPEEFAPEVMAQLTEYRSANGREPVSLAYLLSAVQAAVGLALASLAANWLGGQLPSIPFGWPPTIVQQLVAGIGTVRQLLHRAIASMPDTLADVWEQAQQARLLDLPAFPDWRMVTQLAGLADVPDWAFGNGLPVQMPPFLPSEQLALVAAAATIVWLACNGVLLRGATTIGHRTH